MALLSDVENDVFISAVSVAEISIKRSIGKLNMAISVADLFGPLGALELDLSATHAQAVERLPLLHRDPFDRLLAAQALEENLTLVSADDKVLAYPVRTMDARN